MLRMWMRTVLGLMPRVWAMCLGSRSSPRWLATWSSRGVRAWTVGLGVESAASALGSRSDIEVEHGMERGWVTRLSGIFVSPHPWQPQVPMDLSRRKDDDLGPSCSQMTCDGRFHECAEESCITWVTPIWGRERDSSPGVTAPRLGRTGRSPQRPAPPPQPRLPGPQPILSRGPMGLPCR